MQPSSNNCYDTGLREECGVFGIYDLDGADVSPSIYYGLSALQHRGQESCGIAVSDTSGPKGHVKSYKGLGLVNEVFKESKLEELSGNIGIGHVRYSTTGSTTVENAQPLVLNYLKGSFPFRTTEIWSTLWNCASRWKTPAQFFTLRLTLKSSPTALRGNAFIPKR